VDAAVTVHLMLSAGRGPAECAWAVAELAARLEADASAHSVAVHREQAVAGERPGTLRSVVLGLDGPNAQPFATGWTGTLCWQATSPYRPATGAGTGM
jgi:peptide chain release factor